MFEVNDDKPFRKLELKAGHEYVISFIDFIKSMGFDIGLKYIGTDSVLINGHEFFIDINSASYMSQQAWSRERTIRKPQNRFIALRRYSHDTESIIKIHFNKEYSTDKLRTKITKVISDKEEWIKNQEANEISDKKNTIEIAKRYTSNPAIKELLRSIVIHNGLIDLFIIKIGCLTIDLNNNFVHFVFHSQEAKTPEEIRELLKDLETAKQKISQILFFANSQSFLSHEIEEWAKRTHQKSYNVINDEYSKY